MEIVDEMFAVHKKYEPDLFIAETGLIEKAIGPYLNAEMSKRGVYINLQLMTPTKDKQSRARSLQARLRGGNVYFDTEADWYADLESEMLRFPRDRHDDQVDALSWIGLVLDQLVSAPSLEELDEQEYLEMMNDNSIGRSAVCGY
jgi:predicted phage terminase large subunit-like protein